MPEQEFGNKNKHYKDSELKLLTPMEAAQILGISKKTVHKLVREGKLGCVQVTERDRRFTEEQIQDYIRSKTVPAPIDNKQQRRLKSPPPKGGEKSLGFARTALKKEMQSWQ